MLQAASIPYRVVPGITAALGVQIVGALLVMSLLITPAAAAAYVTASPLKATILSVVFAELAAVGGIIYAGSHNAQAEEAPADAIAGKVDKGIVRVQPDQVASFDIGKPETHEFSNVRQSIGVIDFNQDRTAKVLSPYQGRVSQVLVKAGDDVKAGQVLYTVAVPDMAQASSALISAGATLRNANETLKRAQTLAEDNSIPQKEFLQAQADQQSAKAAYDAAHQNLRLFDLSDAEIAARREAQEARGDRAWTPKARERQVSFALRAYASLATSADKGAVRDKSKLGG